MNFWFNGYLSISRNIKFKLIKQLSEVNVSHWLFIKMECLDFWKNWCTDFNITCGEVNDTCVMRITRILYERSSHVANGSERKENKEKNPGDSRRDATVRNKSDIFISTGVSSVARVRHRASASINIHGPGFLSGVCSKLSSQQRRDVRLAAGGTRFLRKKSLVNHNLRKRSLSRDI